MTTYAEGKALRYPRPGDWARRDHDTPKEERGLVTSVSVDGVVSVAYDGGDDIAYQPDTLWLHRSGWFWCEPEPEEDSGWG